MTLRIVILKTLCMSLLVCGRRVTAFTAGPHIKTIAHSTHPQQLAAASSSQDDASSLDRRKLLLSSIPFLLAGSTPRPAHSRGLVQFPCRTNSLMNTYHFMRVGTTLLEEDNIWSTNPLFLTNRDDALSQTGIEQIVAACHSMEDNDQLPTVVKYSLAAACIDTSNVVGRELKLGRDRLVPEFTFLDPRAIGQWDMLGKDTTSAAVWSLDVDEAGPYGIDGRPPPNDDGTPNDTLSDQSVRLRQVLSILESQYSGDTILLIFPDGTGPALLSAMMAGVPYNRVHELEFGPGELRMNVTPESVMTLWDTKQKNNGEYLATIEEGRQELARLRTQTDFVNLKDQKIEQERLAIDKAYNEKVSKKRASEELEKTKKLERQNQMRARVGGPRTDTEQGSAVAAAGLTSLLGVGAFLAAKSDDTDKQDAGPAMTSSNTVDLGEGNELQYGTNFTDLSDAVGAQLRTETGVRKPQNVGVRLGKDIPQANMTMTKLSTVDSTSSSKPLFEPSKAVNGEKGRFEEAEEAMAKYLDQDDGFDDWLRTIEEIAAEGDNEEDEYDAFG